MSSPFVAVSANLESKRVFGLDVLRTFAILSVCLFHYPFSTHSAPIRLISNHGAAGVDLFFVLSGFLIGGQLFGASARGREVSIPKFYIRRFLRTLPNYFCVLLVFYVLWPGGPLGRAQPLAKFLLFMQNMRPLKTFVPSWSLCVEEHFYLFFPVIALSVIRRVPRDRLLASIRNWTVAFCAFELFLRAALWTWVRPDLLGKVSFAAGDEASCTWIYFFTPTRLDGIAIGVLLAAVSVFGKKAWERALEKAGRWACGGAVLVALAIWSDHWNFWGLGDQGRIGFSGSVLSLTFFAAGFGCWIVPACSSRAAPYSMVGKLFHATAQLSYAMYLLDLPAIYFSNRLLEAIGIESRGILSALFTLVLLFAMSLILYMTVEKPALVLRDRLWAQPKLGKSLVS